MTPNVSAGVFVSSAKNYFPYLSGLIDFDLLNFIEDEAGKTMTKLELILAKCLQKTNNYQKKTLSEINNRKSL